MPGLEGAGVVGEILEDVGAWRPGVPLPRSECVVLAVLARGASVGEAAVTLGLPEQAVRAQLAAAIRALGARSRLEALIIAVRRGNVRLTAVS
jgi:DNA-binding NarL/FixJ family response regulator